FAISQRSCGCPNEFRLRCVRPNRFDEFGKRLSIFFLAMLPAMHAVVENDDIKICATQNGFDLFMQYGVCDETRRGKAANEGASGQTLFHFTKIVASNGITDEQHAREIRFIRMGDPDIAPLNGLAPERDR